MNNFFHSEFNIIAYRTTIRIYSFVSVIWLNLSHMRNATELRESPITDGISLSLYWGVSFWVVETCQC